MTTDRMNTGRTSRAILASLAYTLAGGEAVLELRDGVAMRRAATQAKRALNGMGITSWACADVGPSLIEINVPGIKTPQGEAKVPPGALRLVDASKEPWGESEGQMVIRLKQHEPVA